MVATGNHTTGRRSTPRTGTAASRPGGTSRATGPSVCPSVYSFIYGNVGFISLDANDVSYEIPANQGYSGGSQRSWLAHRLAFLRQQPAIDFFVVYFHHCAFSTTNNHASEGGVRAEWVPLFDKYKVDLVVNGHNHVYERTDAIRGGTVGKAIPIGATVHPATDGTMYVTAGGAGRSLYSFPVPDSYEGHVDRIDSVATYVWAPDGSQTTETVGWSRVRYTGYSFIAVDVVPARPDRTTSLTVRAIAESGAEVDRFSIERVAGRCDQLTRGIDRAQPGPDRVLDQRPRRSHTAPCVSGPPGRRRAGCGFPEIAEPEFGDAAHSWVALEAWGRRGPGVRPAGARPARCGMRPISATTSVTIHCTRSVST